MKTRIRGTGSHLPDFILDNDMLTRMVDTSDEWITGRTGIRERRVNLGSGVLEMAVSASEKALADAGVSPEELDFVIATITAPDYVTPPSACLIQNRLGAVNAFAFDISVACSGFVYALDLADLYIRSGRAKTGLVVSSEMLSRITDYTDRRTCILFGDGAGAAVVRADESRGILSSCLKCDSSDIMCLYAPGIPSREMTGGNFAPPACAPHHLVMEGKGVYKTTTRVVPDTIRNALESAGIAQEDVKFFLFHQANIKIIDSIGNRLGLREDQIPCNIGKYGNTSSATIPILMDELRREGKLREGDILVLSGFGAGITIGSMVLEM